MRLELAAYPPSFQRSPTDVDPFIDRILSQTNVDTEILIGIGDPMRITAVPQDRGKYAEPKVIGGMLQKMCYWLVDRRDFKNGGNGWEEAFERVLVHPKGMTGFTVPCYDYYIRTKATDLSTFTQRLWDDTDPNDERGGYDRINSMLTKEQKPPRKPLAFITMNPLHASEAASFARDYTMVRPFIDQPHFSDAVMTGIIVATDIANAAASHEGRAIHEFKEGVATAIEYILHDPLLSAYRLYRAHEKDRIKIYNPMNDLVHPFFRNWSPQELAEALRILKKFEAFNPSPTLGIKAVQWQKTKAMREIVEPVLTDMEKRRSVKTLTDAACLYE